MNDKEERVEEGLRSIIEILEVIETDQSLPLRVRRSARATIERLLVSDEPLDLKAATANSVLDDLANDPGLPVRWGRRPPRGPSGTASSS